MNWRKPAYLTYAALRGYRFPSLLEHYSREYERGVGDETVTRALANLLAHCRQSVPYYAERLPHLETTDPREYLSRLPVLTKETIRTNFASLQSADLGR